MEFEDLNMDGVFDEFKDDLNDLESNNDKVKYLNAIIDWCKEKKKEIKTSK